MDDAALRHAVQQGLQPLIGSVPEAPSWDDLEIRQRLDTGPKPQPRTWAAAIGVAVLVLITVGVAPALFRGAVTPTDPITQTPLAANSTSSPPPTTSVSAAPPSIASDVGVQSLRAALDHPIPLRLLTASISGYELAELDLERLRVTTYPPGLHAFPNTQTNGAIPTSDRRWIVVSGGVAYRVLDDLEGESARPLGPTRDTPGVAPVARIYQDPAGDSVWVVHLGYGLGDRPIPTLVELLDAHGAPAELSVEIDPNARSVGVTADGLVLTTEEYTDTGDGYATTRGSESMLLVDRAGGLRDIGRGIALAAGRGRIAHLSCREQTPDCSPADSDAELVVTDPDGTSPTIVTRPAEGAWGPADVLPLPNEALPVPTVSPDGSAALLRLGPRLVAVDLTDGSSRLLGTLGDGVATWSADGEWVAVIDGRNLELRSVDDPTNIISLNGVIPADHIPIGVG